MSDHQNSGFTPSPDEFFAAPHPQQMPSDHMTNQSEQIPISAGSDVPPAVPNSAQPFGNPLGGTYPDTSGSYPQPGPYPAPAQLGASQDLGQYPPQQGVSFEPGQYPGQQGYPPPYHQYPQATGYTWQPNASQPYRQPYAQQYPAYPGQTPYPYPQQVYPPMYPQPSDQPGAVPQTKNKTGIIVGIVIAAVVIGIVAIIVHGIISNAPKPDPLSTAPYPTTIPSVGGSQGGSSVNGYQTGVIGQTVSVDYGYDGELDYTVTDVPEVVDVINSFLFADDGMTFVVVPVTITYQGQNRVFSFDDGDTVVATTDDDWYDPSTEAELFYVMPDGGPNPLWLAMLKPGQSVSGVLAYEVDVDEVSGLHLIVGLYSDNPVEIDLQI